MFALRSNECITGAGNRACQCRQAEENARYLYADSILAQ
jgi:hypothetical protein